MLFEMIFLLDSYFRKFTTGTDYPIRLQRLDLEALSCIFVVSSLPTFVVDGSKSFSFQSCSLIWIVSSTTPDSVSLVHGFTHDKSVPDLFWTPQVRSH